MPNQSDKTKKSKLKSRSWILLDEVLHWEVPNIFTNIKIDNVKRKKLYDIFKDFKDPNNA